MPATGKVILMTVFTWVPILLLFYLPNNLWGISLKVLAALFLISCIYDFLFCYAYFIYGAAGAGFILNAIWFTIINFHPPWWLRLFLWFLIITGWMTCRKILKERYPELERP